MSHNLCKAVRQLNSWLASASSSQSTGEGSGGKREGLRSTSRPNRKRKDRQMIFEIVDGRDRVFYEMRLDPEDGIG